MAIEFVFFGGFTHPLHDILVEALSLPEPQCGIEVSLSEAHEGHNPRVAPACDDLSGLVDQRFLQLPVPIFVFYQGSLVEADHEDDQEGDEDADGDR